MKTRTFLTIMMFLFVTSFLCAEERPFFNNDELTGTWIIDSEAEQRVGIAFQNPKLIFYHWGYWETFSTVDSTDYVEKGTIQIIDKWTDSKGNTLYKAYEMNELMPSIPLYDFGRISKDGCTWEIAYSRFDFPTESDFNIKNKYYLIYHRQE